jgi:hypothetical protein
MKTSNISIPVTTRDGKKTYNGRGVIAYPFVIHRNIKDTKTMTCYKNDWCISHISSGRAAFYAKTLNDAELMIGVLRRFDLFKMPDCAKFHELCRRDGSAIREALSNEGYSFITTRFRNA